MSQRRKNMIIDAGCASASASVYRSFYDTLMISLRQYLVTYSSLLLLLRLFCAILMLLSDDCLVTLTSLLLLSCPFYATVKVMLSPMSCRIQVTLMLSSISCHFHVTLATFAPILRHSNGNAIANILSYSSHSSPSLPL